MMVEFPPNLFYVTIPVDLTDVSKSVTHAVLQVRHSSQKLLDAGFTVHVINSDIPLNFNLEERPEVSFTIFSSTVIRETVMSSHLPSAIALLSSISVLTSSILPSSHDLTTSTSDLSTVRSLPPTSSETRSAMVTTAAQHSSPSYLTVHTTSVSIPDLSTVRSLPPTSSETHSAMVTMATHHSSPSYLTVDTTSVSIPTSSLSVPVTKAVVPTFASMSSAHQMPAQVSSYSGPRGTNLLPSLSHVQYDTVLSTHKMTTMTLLHSEVQNTDSLSSITDALPHLVSSSSRVSVQSGVRSHPSETDTESVIHQTDQLAQVTTTRVPFTDEVPSIEVLEPDTLSQSSFILIGALVLVCGVLLVSIAFFVVAMVIRRHNNRTGSYSPAKCESNDYQTVIM